MSSVISCYLELHFPLPYDEVQSHNEHDSFHCHGKTTISRMSSKSPTSYLTTFFQYVWQLLKFFLVALQFNVSHLLSGIPFLLKQRTQCTIANCLLSLMNEATRTTTRELWISSENTQLAFLKIFGNLIDKKLMKASDNYWALNCWVTVIALSCLSLSNF